MTYLKLPGQKLVSVHDNTKQIRYLPARIAVD